MVVKFLGYIFTIQKRNSHFKFSANMLKKQSEMLKNFDKEIGNAMEKIRTNKKIKTNRNKVALSKTTDLLMKMGVENSEPISYGNFASGSPEQLVIRREGLSKSFITTRMKILNNTYTRAVSEIFISNEKLFSKMEEYGIRITQVRVSPNNRILHIYWTLKDENTEVKLVADYLNKNRGRIYDLLLETNYGNHVPWIAFIYDLQESNEREISTRLKKCQKDLVQEEPSIPDLDFMEELSKVQTSHSLTDQISFENPLESLSMDEYYEKMLEYNPNEYYLQQRYRLPPDMTANVFNLDYCFLMNKVLQNLHRLRPQQRINAYNYNLVGEHLPPINPNKMAIESNLIVYNTDERINAIRKFVSIQRKRKNKEELKLKRMILENEIDRFDSYEQLQNSLEKSMAEFYKDQFENDDKDDDIDNFKPIN